MRYVVIYVVIFDSFPRDTLIQYVVISYTILIDVGIT